MLISARLRVKLLIYIRKKGTSSTVAAANKLNEASNQRHYLSVRVASFHGLQLHAV